MYEWGIAVSALASMYAPREPTALIELAPEDAARSAAFSVLSTLAQCGAMMAVSVKDLELAGKCMADSSRYTAAASILFLPDGLERAAEFLRETK